MAQDQRYQGRLRGKRVLITGATGFLGTKFSETFASAGADLVLASRTPSKLAALADRLRESAGVAVHVHALDLADKVAVEGLADVAWDALGGLDVLLLNAAPTNDVLMAGGVVETPEDLWQQMQDLIVWSPLWLVRRVAPKMADAGIPGSVITVVSPAGFTPTKGLAAYGLAKGSLAVLTRLMAQEWGPAGIRINAINPGGIITDPSEEERITAKALEAGVFNRISMGRFGRNDEMLGITVHLASDESTFMSGQVLTCDGARF